MERPLKWFKTSIPNNPGCNPWLLNGDLNSPTTQGLHPGLSSETPTGVIISWKI